VASDTTPFIVDADGNVGIGATPGAYSLVVKGSSGNNTGLVSIYKYGGTSASPVETTDWPDPVLTLRGYDGNYTQATMLSFGYPGDANYQTTDAVWNFRLDGTTGATSSSSSTNLRLGGPGTLTIPAGRVQLSASSVLEAPLVQNAQTGTAYTLVLADAGKLVELNNASAITVTIPLASSVQFPIGTQINLLQTGAGQVTVAAGGTTLNATPGLKLRAQWSSATLIKRAGDTWVLVGDLSA
jgi:hypothetical protein